MREDLKKIPTILGEIVQKLGAADKAVLAPYVDQMNKAIDDIKKSGQENLQSNLTKILDLTEKIKEAKIGDIPGVETAINMIQSLVKDKMDKKS